MYKINILLKQKQKLFHTNDLALLWKINNPNTLYTTIKRYVKKGVLIRIHKGFYSVLPLKNIDPIKLGISYLHTYAYLSAESVLVAEGIIFQASEYITLISSLSKKFTINSHSYLVRQMKPNFLYQTAGIENKEAVKIASLERAVADILYFNPRFHFDNPKTINWQKVRKIQKEVRHQ